MANENNPQAMLRSDQICVLATVSADGSPHAMPMWFLYEDDAIWFMTGGRSQKAKNVKRTGVATVVLDTREVPYYAIMVKGAAEVLPAMDYDKRLRMVTKYLGDKDARIYLDSKVNPDLATIKVALGRIVEFNGSARSSAS